MFKDNVIKILKESNGFVSGEYIAEKFCVSRMKVNLAIKELISDGYRITAIKNKGYKLEFSPEAFNLLELSDYLSNCKNIYFLESVSSTNDYLKELARKGADDGTVVFSETQTAGKGRLGRSFYSPKNNGIYLSYLYRPKCSVGELATLTARVAVAVSSAIEKVCGIKVEIKWVNDLLLNEKKICGILTEMSIIGEGMNPEFAVVGIGVNVNNSKENFEGELKRKATSIFSESGKKVCRVELLAEIIKNLRTLFETDISEAMRYYRNRCYTIGKEVEFEVHGNTVSGFVEGIDDNNGLIVRLDDKTITVNSGIVRIKTLKGYC